MASVIPDGLVSAVATRSPHSDDPPKTDGDCGRDVSGVTNSWDYGFLLEDGGCARGVVFSKFEWGDVFGEGGGSLIVRRGKWGNWGVGYRRMDTLRLIHPT